MALAVSKTPRRGVEADYDLSDKCTLFVFWQVYWLVVAVSHGVRPGSL
jgi:hypothetical protein